MKLAVAEAASLPRCPTVAGCVITIEVETPEFPSLREAVAFYTGAEALALQLIHPRGESFPFTRPDRTTTLPEQKPSLTH